MRTITNHYRDSHVLNLGPGSERGPYLVVATGVPRRSTRKRAVFAARPDGRWVDFNAYACQGKPEAIDEIVFSNTTEVMEAFGKLMGRPQVLDVPVDEAGLKAWDRTSEAAIHWKQLTNGRWDIGNAAAKSVVAKVSRHYGQRYCRNERDCGKLRTIGV